MNLISIVFTIEIKAEAAERGDKAHRRRPLPLAGSVVGTPVEKNFIK